MSKKVVVIGGYNDIGSCQLSTELVKKLQENDIVCVVKTPAEHNKDNAEKIEPLTLNLNVKDYTLPEHTTKRNGVIPPNFYRKHGK